MTTSNVRAQAPGQHVTPMAPESGGTPARRAPGAGIASFSPGARWLAEQAGYPQPTRNRNPWARGLLAEIPLGRGLSVVRVPAATAAKTLRVLTDWDMGNSPVLDAGHVWAFLIHPSMTDGRDIPGGALLTGAAREVLRCPEPGQLSVPPWLWVVAPDGSGDLLDPWTLAEALRPL